MQPQPSDSLRDLNYNGFPVLHLFHQYRSVGGVESVLRLHHQHDPQIGVQSDLVIFLDDPSLSAERLHCLGIEFDDSVGVVGEKLRRVAETMPGRMAIYHLAWNFAFFSPNDQAKRRILVIHTETPGLKRFLKRNSQYVDGILCVNRQMKPAVEASVPASLHDRIEIVGCPITPPDQSRATELLSRPVQLGFIGRLTVNQKRIDRIPEFCRAIEDLAIPYSFDLLGAGSDTSLLEANRNTHKLMLRGVLQGSDYWSRVRELDCIVFFSDFEGTPISLLEAMSQGVIPIYPKINSGADSYVAAVSPELLYPAGDTKAAAEILARLSKMPPNEITSLRQRCRQAVQGHSLANYFSQTFGFSQRIWAMPRISRTSAPLSVKLLHFFTLRQLDAVRRLTRTPTR